MNVANKRENIRAEIERGRESFRAAEVLMAQSLYADAISRAYYAAFHAATALLLTRGIEAKSHAGVLNRFSLLFIKPGLFDSSYGRVLSRAQKYREESDYSAAFVFTEHDAQQCITDVQRFLRAARAYLKKHRFMAK
ncbi:MAG: HEPN domain-containing protein [Deltaproteobacteria bacterium]|nr:HEPN domain-containing protein [Deltaproteobacteria bacterium]